MALQLGALRDALLEAGASEAKAALAAEELAAYKTRFDGLEQGQDQVERKIDSLHGEMKERFASLHGEMIGRFATVKGDTDAPFAEMVGRLTRIEWMLGTLIVLVLGVLGRLLLVH